MPVIELPLSFDDIDQVLALSELLQNSTELIAKFTPSVSKFLVKKNFFRGPFLREYNYQFDEMVRSLVKKEVVEQFPGWTPEEILLLTEVSFLKMIAPELFIQESYKENK